MAFITVHVTGLTQEIDRLDALAVKLHDFGGAFAILGTMLGKYFSGEVFASQGAVLGSRWARLSDKTVSEKNRSWPGRGILERSGELRRSFTSDVTPLSLFVTNKSPYFPYHQLGTSDGRGRGHNIPARPMLGVNEPVRSMIKDVIEADIRAKIEMTNG